MDNKATKSRLIPGIGRIPFPAYRGQGRYIFVSYAHADKEQVFPEIIRFQEMGYNIWYDEEITPGNEWKQHITDRLVNCDLFIIFITNRSANSKNCRKEFYCALNNNKHIIPFYLEDFDTVEIDEEWKTNLSEIQGILMTTYDDEEAYIFKFSEAFRNFGFEIFNFSKRFIEKTLYESQLNSKMKSYGLHEHVDDFFNRLYVNENSKKSLYVSIFKSSLDFFIDNPGEYFADEVYLNFINLYEMILGLEREDFSNTNPIHYFYNTLKKYDKKQSRQNFIHSVNVFVLGLAIYSQNKGFRKNFQDYIKDYGIDYLSESRIHEEFLIRWGIASLFHDSCFAIETNEKKVKNRIFKELKQFLNYDEDCLMGGLNEFNILPKTPRQLPTIVNLIPSETCENADIDIIRPTDLLAVKIARDMKLDGKGLKQVKNNLTFFLNYAYDNDFDEHGILASVMLLNCFSMLDDENLSPLPNHFHYTILDSASAILLHNYYHYILQADPFNFKRLRSYEIPLAYLLILCDEIMETSVNSIYFEISEEIYAKYYLESSSNGFGFHDKLQLLNHILDIRGIFKREITLVKDIKPHALFEIKKKDFEKRYVEPPTHLVERIARERNNQYNELVLKQYKANDNPDRYESLRLFDELPITLQRADFNSAKSICRKLQFMRYDIVSINDTRECITDFLEIELEELAKLEHEEWCDEKIALGWTYGEIRDNEKLTTPHLVPWEELMPEIRMYDIDPIKNLPTLLSRMDLKIANSKLKLLTFELYDHVSKFTGVEVPFECLKLHIQELNYQKTDLIVEALFEINYNIVDVDEPGDAVMELSPDEIDYIETTVSREYLKKQINLGLEVDNYLEGINDAQTQKLNDILVDSFPQLCGNVGLKIVKID